MKAKFVYKNLVNKVIELLPTVKFSKWEELLIIDTTEWSEYFRIIKKSCKDVYLRTFQYKFLHRIIATDTFLYKIELKDSKMCTFCKLGEETIEHLFFECPITFQLW